MTSASLLVAAGFVLIAGLLTHSFIALVNIHCWMKGRSVTPIDQILTSLGVSRMLIPIFSIFDLFLSLYLNTDSKNGINVMVDSLLLFFNYNSIWLATLFSVMFCIKIATFQNHFYLRLKVIISEQTVHMIIASLLISFSYIGIILWVRTSVINSANSTEVSVINSSQQPEMNITYMYLYMFWNILPFLIYCVATFLLVISLCLHLHRMKRNNNISVQYHAYYIAIRSLIFCFACYALHVTSNVFVLYYVDKLGLLWFYIIFNVFPAMHSLFLIHKTGHLRHRVSQMFSCKEICICKKKIRDVEDIIT